MVPTGPGVGPRCPPQQLWLSAPQQQLLQRHLNIISISGLINLVEKSGKLSQHILVLNSVIKALVNNIM